MRLVKDARAQISLDFMSGISLFIVAFIFIALFVPSIFVPFKSDTVDLNSVAYRTSVILTEDPGWFSDDVNNRRGINWEENVPDMSRIGLAVDKDYPNVLDREKIATFNDNALIDDETLVNSLGLFRTINGNDISYGHNIMIETLEDGTIIATRGDVAPESGDVASIKRVVLTHTSNEFDLDGDDLLGRTPIPSTYAQFNITEPEDDLTIVLKKLIVTGPNPSLQTIRLDDDSNGILDPISDGAIITMGTDATPCDYRVWIDQGAGYVQQNPGGSPCWNNPNLVLPSTPLNSSSKIRITISRDTFNLNPGVTNMISINFNQIDIISAGSLDLNNLTAIPRYEPSQLTVQVWL